MQLTVQELYEQLTVNVWHNTMSRGQHHDLSIILTQPFNSITCNKLQRVILTSNNKLIVVVNCKLTDIIIHSGISEWWLSNAQGQANWLVLCSKENLQINNELTFQSVYVTKIRNQLSRRIFFVTFRRESTLYNKERCKDTKIYLQRDNFILKYDILTNINRWKQIKGNRRAHNCNPRAWKIFYKL